QPRRLPRGTGPLADGRVRRDRARRRPGRDLYLPRHRRLAHRPRGRADRTAAVAVVVGLLRAVRPGRVDQAPGRRGPRVAAVGPRPAQRGFAPTDGGAASDIPGRSHGGLRPLGRSGPGPRPPAAVRLRGGPPPAALRRGDRARRALVVLRPHFGGGLPAVV